MLLTLYILGLLAFWLIATWACAEELNDRSDPLVFVAIPLVSLFWPLLLVPLVVLAVVDGRGSIILTQDF